MASLSRPPVVLGDFIPGEKVTTPQKRTASSPAESLLRKHRLQPKLLVIPPPLSLDEEEEVEGGGGPVTMSAIKAMFRAETGRLQSTMTEQFNKCLVSLNAQVYERLDDVDVEVEQLKTKFERLQRNFDELEMKMEEAENRSRRNNLRFSGVPMRQGENCIAVIQQMCAEVLEIPQPVFVNRAHRTAPNRFGQKDLIAHFPNDYDIRQIYSRVKKFKEKNFKIFVARDVVGRAAHVERVLVGFRKKLKDDKKVDIKLAFGGFFFKDFRFSVDKWNDGLLWGREDGLKKMEELLGFSVANLWDGSISGEEERLKKKKREGGGDGETE